MLRSRLATLLALVALGTPVAAASAGPGTEGPALAVDVAAARHAISPDIYGMNFPDEALARELQLPVDRWGGNSTSRYNWHSKTTNRANDYYFTNTAFGGGIPGEVDLDATIARDKRVGAKSLVTVPLLGYVTDPGKTGACGFSVKKYGKQTDHNDDCGNGAVSDNKKITGNDPLDTSIRVGPDFVTDEVKHLVSTYGSATSGGVPFYSLDNEPGIWENTHQDVHPAPLTYDELAQRGITYAKAIKAGDPGAKVFGPVDWGFIAYLDSEADIVANDTHDKDAHGGEELTAWYLDQMKAYQDAHGQRLLDYLDEHYYPADGGLSLASEGDAKKQRERFDATRALWDPTYLDQSYIGNDMKQKINLIPRLKGYIADHYPGTKLAITEYNFGGVESVNGALVEADALGIFGREGLDLATMWSAPGSSDAAANAFRIFRNYNHSGGTFGDTSVAATSADQGKLSIYAAQRTADHALTVVVINKSHDDLRAPVAIVHGPAASAADVWTYSGADIQQIVPNGSVRVSDGRIDTTFPAQSISLLVVPGSGHNATTSLNVRRGSSPAAANSQHTTRHVNLPLLTLAGLFLVAFAVGFGVPAWRRRLPALVLVATLVGCAAASGAAVALGSTHTTFGEAGGSTPAAGTANPITITSLHDGGRLKGGDSVSGTVKLAAGQKLFTEVFSAGSDLYY
ncbi:MAG: endoglucanase, partial [Actinobacteria bacterium]|nr:endoglucanase [Actinomycetota bacterium]